MRHSITIIGVVVVTVLAATFGAISGEDQHDTQHLSSSSSANANATQLDWATPVLNAAMCPLTKDPWDCGRQQAARMLDVFIADVELTKQKIKDEADANLVDRIAHRAFSESDLPEMEKPSAVMTTLDNYITNGVLSFMGRKTHMNMKKPSQHQHQQQQHQHQQQHRPQQQQQQHLSTTEQHQPDVQHYQHAGENETDDDDDEDSDEDDEEPQVFEGHVQHHHGLGLAHKRPHHIGGHGHRKPFHHKYGRDLGVSRGKKKKKFKKAILKLLVLAALLKVKFEFLLKVMATHLQAKFFIIAALGLLLNAAKFWIDLKKGHSPQKVIYYEHAQHQHHYDDHADEGWGGGGYWKRSLDTEDAVDDEDTGDRPTIINAQSPPQPQFRQARSAQHMAYSQQKPINVV